MRRRAGWLAAAAVLALASCGGSSGGRATQPHAAPGPRLTPQLARTLDARLRAGVKQTFIPGVTAAVVFPDGREWSGAAAAAILRPRTPMTSRTSISFDSVTKVATAALAMRLVEQGRLRLDDPIRRWYARWRGDPRATVRDLLGHTSGLGEATRRTSARSSATRTAGSVRGRRSPRRRRPARAPATPSTRTPGSSSPA